MTLPETFNPNASQLPYVATSSIESVREIFGGAGTLEGVNTRAIYAEYREAAHEDPAFAQIIKATLETYIETIGLSGRAGDYKTDIYTVHPIVDYLKGAVMARDILKVQYANNGDSLPDVSQAAEAIFTQKQAEAAKRVVGFAFFPSQIKETLMVSGCGQEVLDAVTERGTSVIERLGALEVLSLYAEQATVSESEPATEPHASL